MGSLREARKPIKRCQRTEAQREVCGLAQRLCCGNIPRAPSKKAVEAARMGGFSYEDWASSALRRYAASGLGLSIIPTMVCYDASVTIHIQTHPLLLTIDQSSCPHCDLLYWPELCERPFPPHAQLPPARAHLSKGRASPWITVHWALLQHLSSALNSHSSLTSSPNVNTCAVSQLSTPALEVPPLTYPHAGPWQLLFHF